MDYEKTKGQREVKEMDMVYFMVCHGTTCKTSIIVIADLKTATPNIAFSEKFHRIERVSGHMKLVAGERPDGVSPSVGGFSVVGPRCKSRRDRTTDITGCFIR